MTKDEQKDKSDVNVRANQTLELTVDQDKFIISAGYRNHYHLRCLQPTTIEIYAGFENVYELYGEPAVLDATRVVAYAGYKNKLPSNIPAKNIRRIAGVY